MLVADASVIAPAVADAGSDGQRYRRRLRHQQIAAPDLLRIEVFSVLRRQLRMGAINNAEATAATEDLLDLPMIIYPTAPLLRRGWELRDNFTAYDACYVALAEVLDCGLLTADVKMSRPSDSRCDIEVI